MPTNGDLSLYFHLPFCQKKCDYCHFFVLPNKEEFKKELLRSLAIELDLKWNQIKQKNLVSIYFGGGTPSLIEANRLEPLLNRLSTLMTSSTEVTLELNPENSSYEALKAYRDIGINRLSIGVQSLDEALLKKLSREHSKAQILKCIETASKAGFENLSIDLMYDAPTQTLDSWEKTLLEVTHLPIAHLSLYNLSIEKHTVFYKKIKEIEKQLPSHAESLEMFQMAHHLLSQSDLHPYEISAFCKGQAFSKHNVGYWLQRNHAGLGPSAFSLQSAHRFQNVKNLKRYSELLDQKIIPIDFEEELSKEAFLRESLILNLRLLQGVDLDYFQKRFGALSSEILDALAKMQTEGFLEIGPHRIFLTAKGLLHHDTVACELV